MPEFVVNLETSCSITVEAETAEEAEELANEKAAYEMAYWDVTEIIELES